MSDLRRTTFSVSGFAYSSIAIDELATPSFSAVTVGDPALYFNVEFPHSHPLRFEICDLLDHPCEVHVSLARRFSLLSTLSPACEYDCHLLPSPDAVVRLPSSFGTSRLVVHWDGRTQSVTAKRSRGSDTVTDFEREYKSWRFGSDL
ncbi:P17 [Pycnonotidae orthoreovirus]|uniref:P17 n=1 Tax=Pycnonotidae orthoreovirus TaxID=3070176 RepID=A0A0B6VK21_9REOV|nr:P17 [Avian orthoreovirus]BAQ19500.1 P17 [Avian orthoreovirus]